MNYKLKATYTTGAAVSLSLVALLVYWRDIDSFLIALIGMLCGWWLGVILAPYAGESEKFQKLSKGVVGLVSGVTLAKVFDFLRSVLEHSNQGVWDELVLRRIGFGFCSFLLTGLVVFVARSYAD